MLTRMSPLAQAGPQHLLITLLGTYFLGQRGPIPSAFLVKLLQEFGISEVGARNGVSRLAKRGLLELCDERRGRQTYYRLSQEAHEHHPERLSEIVTFGQTPILWDGTWNVVMFSVAERDRSVRHLIRQQLAGQRYGMLFDGVWVRPGLAAEHVKIALRSVGVHRAVVLNGASVEAVFGDADPVTAFPLDDLRARYESFIEHIDELTTRMRSGSISPAEALVRRSEVMDSWRYFPDNDPLLPAEILPPDWPLERARESFQIAYDGLAELADHRLRALLSDYDSAFAANVRSVTAAELESMNIPPRRMGPLTGSPQTPDPEGPDDE